METIIREDEILKIMPKWYLSLKTEDIPYSVEDEIPKEYRLRFFPDNQEQEFDDY